MLRKNKDQFVISNVHMHNILLAHIELEMDESFRENESITLVIRTLVKSLLSGLDVMNPTWSMPSNTVKISAALG